MASYMDMVTVLMCLFIVLYAMSTVDAEKWENLKLALATGFGQTQSDTVDTAVGIVVPENLAGLAGPEEGYAGYSEEPTEVTELGELQGLAASVSEALAAAGIDATGIEYHITDQGLTIGLTGAQAFFDGNSAGLRSEAVAVLDAIGPTLVASGREISIAGHADPHNSSYPYPTDWELAGARATAVLRYLVESRGLPGPLISATTFGSTRPASDDVSQNRRVDILILSQDPAGLATQLADASDASRAADPASPTPGEEPAPSDH